MNPRLRFAQAAVVASPALALIPAAVAARPAESGGTSCTPGAPGVSIDNTWAWASPGSWGLPGQQLKYAVRVSNNDLGCGSSTFGISMSAADGFSVSLSQSTVTLESASSVYVWSYVTSPSTVADGDYPLTATVVRAGVRHSSFTSSYKVYSSDTLAPKLYWMNPANGGSLGGRTTYVGFASSDDHALRQLELFLDNSLVATTVCDHISYECQVSYKWTLRRVRGQHTATFKSTDWLGNVSSQTSTFTVN